MKNASLDPDDASRDRIVKWKGAPEMCWVRITRHRNLEKGTSNWNIGAKHMFKESLVEWGDPLPHFTPGLGGCLSLKTESTEALCLTVQPWSTGIGAFEILDGLVCLLQCLVRFHRCDLTVWAS